MVLSIVLDVQAWRQGALIMADIVQRKPRHNLTTRKVSEFPEETEISIF